MTKEIIVYAGSEAEDYIIRTLEQELVYNVFDEEQDFKEEWPDDTPYGYKVQIIVEKIKGEK
jgi:hypothetical protein